MACWSFRLNIVTAGRFKRAVVWCGTLIHMAETHPILAWADADQESLVRDVASHPAVDIVAVGSDSADAAARLSTNLGIDRIDDLRRASQHEQAQLLWIASPTHMEPALAKTLRERGWRCASCQPFPASLTDLPASPEDIAAIRFTPPMRRSDGFRAATDILADFGEARCVNVTMRSGTGQGGLFARLFDAVDVVESLCGVPEIIDAALVSRMSGVAEHLADLHGHMTINLRFPENRCACVAVSDQAGTWFRGVTVLGDGGCLRISDDGFEWIAESGEVLDSHESTSHISPGQLIAHQLVRMLEHRGETDAPPDASKLLAICEAARLSCRTGEGETPRKVLKMLSNV